MCCPVPPFLGGEKDHSDFNKHYVAVVLFTIALEVTYSVFAVANMETTPVQNIFPSLHSCMLTDLFCFWFVYLFRAARDWVAEFSQAWVFITLEWIKRVWN